MFMCSMELWKPNSSPEKIEPEEPTTLSQSTPKKGVDFSQRKYTRHLLLPANIVHSTLFIATEQLLQIIYSVCTVKKMYIPITYLLFSSFIKLQLQC